MAPNRVLRVLAVALVSAAGLPARAASGPDTLKAEIDALMKFHATWSRTGTTLNGTDIAPWFAVAQGEPRLLRLEEPPLKGDDVRAVQSAVAKHRVEPFRDGVYDTATALAVARFQKDAGLDANGVIDAPTRAKLGPAPATVAPAPAAPPRK